MLLFFFLIWSVFYFSRLRIQSKVNSYHSQLRIVGFSSNTISSTDSADQSGLKTEMHNLNANINLCNVCKIMKMKYFIFVYMFVQLFIFFLV